MGECSTAFNESIEFAAIVGMNGLEPGRTLEELKELRRLTSDENGAQRVAFTPTWAKARAWLQEKARDRSARKSHRDEAGNLWTTLRGESEKALLIGGHIDSVPNGGWLDGCLNTLAGLEILRRINAQYDGKPPVTVRLVDWADEEGARFGKSLFGSSACSGNLDMDEARGLKDKDGITLAGRAARAGDRFREGERLRQRTRRTPRPISSCTSSKDRCCSISICRSARCSARSASSATRSLFTARPRIPAARR